MTAVNGLNTSISLLGQQQFLTDYKLTPATLMARLDPGYITSKWILYLSWKIAKCVAKGSCGLLISAPPRHGKSKLATITTPLWVLENFPTHHIGVVTYGEDLSTDFSREVRDYIQKNQNLLSVRLRPDITRVANFLTMQGGGLKAVGLRGTITGRGFNVLVIDDYIKEPKEAESPKYLEDLYTWYQTVARTRLEPGAVIIIVATRWTRNDLHGKLMKLQELTGRDFFEMVSLPALAYHPPMDDDGTPLPKDRWPLGYPDPLGRLPGEALFPERYTAEDMENMQAEMESRWWNAMFQQNPEGSEGAVIDTSMFYKVEAEEYQRILRDYYAHPANYKVGRYWDMASSKNAGDYVVGARAIFNLKTLDFLIDDVVRGQFGPGKTEAIFKQTCEKDLRQFPTISLGIEEEPGSSGTYSVRHFQGILDTVDASQRLVSENAASKGAKLLAASPYIGHIERGKVGLRDLPWAKPFLSEHEVFPEGLHDDQVDATSGCYRLLKGLIGRGVTWGRDPASKAFQQQIRAGNGEIPSELAHHIGAVWGRRTGGTAITPPEGVLTELPPGMEQVNG